MAGALRWHWISSAIRSVNLFGATLKQIGSRIARSLMWPVNLWTPEASH